MNGRKFSDCSYCKYYGNRDNQFPCNGCNWEENDKLINHPTLFVERGVCLPPYELSKQLLSNYFRKEGKK